MRGDFVLLIISITIMFILKKEIYAIDDAMINYIVLILPALFFGMVGFSFYQVFLFGSYIRKNRIEFEYVRNKKI